jgi:acetyl esterase/lipase
VGMIGFSAGGHLVMSAACFNEVNFLEANGIDTEVSLRPTFVAPIYPVVTMHEPYVHKRSRRALLSEKRHHNPTMIDSLSLECHIPADCPPVFLVNCIDDPVVEYHNSILLDSALTANKVNHRYIQYQTGGHGFGASEEKGTAECRQWKQEFLNWIQQFND